MIDGSARDDKNNDDLVLQKYRQIYNRYLRDGVIDIDKRLKHEFNFQIYPLEMVLPEIKGIVPPSRQTHYWIALFKKGAGQKSIGLYTFPVTENTLFIVPTRVIHSSKYSSLECSGYLLLFNVDFFLNNTFPKHLIKNKKVFKHSIRPYLYLTDAQVQSLSAMFECILHEQAKDELERNEMIAIKVLEILISCDRMFTDAEQIGDNIYYHPVIEKFNNLLDGNFAKEKTAGFYAKALYMHANSLNFLIKKHLGISVKQSINNRIVAEAKHLLAHSNMAVKMIADQLGFDEPRNFSTFFRKHALVTPLAFRASTSQL